ncbi:MAG TPA: OsmC family protein [Burkholderiaceae bacterium]
MHRHSAEFHDNRYSRAHETLFDGGLRVMGSSSPQNVPPPMSVPGYMDPEEALVASLSSCHMLVFLYLATKAGFVVDTCRDHAMDQMEEIAPGKPAITRIVLRPAIAFSGARLPTPSEFDALHRTAHENCYIANSIKAKISIEPERIAGLRSEPLGRQEYMS